MASTNRSSESSRKCSRSFILWLLQTLFVVCFIIWVIWLAVTPKHPVYEVVDVYISPVFQNARNSTSLQQVGDVTQNMTSSTVTAIILRLEISNPNRVIGIGYNETYMALYHVDMGVGFGAVTLSGFYQEGRRDSTTTREVRVDVDQQLYLRGIQGRRFNMQICLKTKVQYRILSSKTKHHQMSYGAKIRIGEDGRMIGVDNKLHHERHSRSCF